MYVFESGFVLSRDVNPVSTQYVVSELKNLVNLIDHIDKFRE